MFRISSRTVGKWALALVIALAGTSLTAFERGATLAVDGASTVEVTVEEDGSIRNEEWGIYSTAWAIDMTAQFDTIDEICFDIVLGAAPVDPEGGFVHHVFWDILPPAGSPPWWWGQGLISEYRVPVGQEIVTVCGTNDGAGFDETELPFPTRFGIVGEDDVRWYTTEELDISIAAVRVSGSRLTCDGHAATIVGTEGDDTIVGTEGADVVVALGGTDDIRTYAGDDRVCSGDGDDTIDTGHGDDFVRAGAGDDSVVTRWGEDLAHGDRGDDHINLGLDDDTGLGGDGNDVVIGHDGNDVIGGGGCADELWGWKGDDSIWNGYVGDTHEGTAQLFPEPCTAKRGRDHLWGGPGADLFNGGGFHYEICRDPDGPC